MFRARDRHRQWGLIALSVITLGEQVYRHVMPLSALQIRTLTLLGVSPTTCDRLCTQAPNTS